jgi:hypothetical protein
LSSITEFPPKATDEVKDYRIDWASRLATSETIASSSWSVPSGLTQPSSPTSTDTTATVWLGSGTAGTRYRVVNRITTSASRVYEQSFYVRALDPDTLDELQLVRLTLGDTDSSDQIFSDEHVILALATYGRPKRAAYELALGRRAFYARKVSRTIDGLSVSYSDLVRHWTSVIDTLRQELNLESVGALGGAGLYVGGLTISEKIRDRSQYASRTQHRFRREQFQNDEGPGRDDDGFRRYGGA